MHKACPCFGPLKLHGRPCSSETAAARQLIRDHSSHMTSPSTSAGVGLSYLVTVHSVLGRPGSYGDGVWLTAAVALTVTVFNSLSEHT